MILGKIPPPYMGPSIATQIILNSSLKNKYELLHIDTRVNDSLNTMGKFSLHKVRMSFDIWFKMLSTIIIKRPSLVIIPISQSTAGYLKDFVFILIAKLTFRKTLVHLRGSNFRSWLNSSSIVTKLFVTLSLKINNGVIVLGNNLRPLFNGIFSEDKIFVCPNGGNYEIPSAATKSDEIKILYLANLQPSKGIEDVLCAMLKLKGKVNVSYSLSVVGNWRSAVVEKSCKELVRKYNLQVLFFPPATGENKLQYLADADIFVFTPREPEGHPWVIVEAMAAGLPIISTDQGAIVESVKHNVNGFIVATENPDEIAAQLKILLLDSELRMKMGKESRISYENQFTEEKMVGKLTKIVETVIA